MGRERAELREVGPRDGLQNEPAQVPTEEKVSLVRRLAACGLSSVEVTACVSPRWVPQMADHAEVIAGVGPPPAGTVYAALVPNLRGLEAALHANIGTVAVLTAASGEFAQRNLNCSIEESLGRAAEVAKAAKAAGKSVRGYVSTVVDCPYSGRVDPGAVAETAAAMAGLGCDEISLGDTIGSATPSSLLPMLDAVLEAVPADRLAGHFHDTWGGAVANVAAALGRGIRVFDSSVAGLGGCPYAPGAAGNVATEDVVRFLEGEGLDTGVDLDALVRVGEGVSRLLGRDYRPKAGLASVARRKDGI